MGREGRDYWEAQLSEYWDSGLTIQEYSELKELPYESTRRWIRVLEKARQDDASDPELLELVEIKPLQTNASDSSGIRLLPYKSNRLASLSLGAGGYETECNSNQRLTVCRWIKMNLFPKFSKNSLSPKDVVMN